MLTKEEVLKIVEENNIEFIDIGYLDYAALSRIRTIRADELEKAFDNGINFFGGMMGFNSFDQYIADSTFKAEDGDFFGIPDPSTFAILPYRNSTARLYCDLVDIHGEPWAGCPRFALKRLTEEAEKEFGGQIMMAFEQEAYLLKENDGELETVDGTHCFSIEGIQMQESFLQDFVKAMEISGVKIEKMTSEYGPGQFEINLKHKRAVRAADEQLLFMQLFKQIALKKGMVGTLLPKPFQDLPGSGLHVHVSMMDENGNNVFEDPDSALGLTDKAMHFIGGIMKHARSIVALGAPSINSYKRMYPGSFAPSHVCYGLSNRSALIRVTEKRRGSRFEFRGADGTSNPFILASSLIAAGLDGVRNKIDPGEPIETDVTALSEEEINNKGIKLVPGSLSEAMDELQSNAMLARELGPIWQEFINVKRSEAEKEARRVSNWERNELSYRF